MRIRSNFWLAAAAICLLAYVFLVERRAGQRISGPGGASAVFVPVPVEQVTGIELSISNRVLSIERAADRDASWRMRLPLDAPADAARVNGLLRALSELKVRSYVGANEVAAAGGPRAFGLEGAGAVRLTLSRQGSTPILFHLGMPTLGGGRFYLQNVGDTGVFVADRALLHAIPLAVDDWRDRQLLVPPRDGLDRLELSGPVDFRADRESNGLWRLKRPLEARADSDRLNSLIGLATKLQIERFISDRPGPDMEQFGLTPMAPELILGRGAQDWWRLRIGQPVPGSSDWSYALRNGSNVVTVATSLRDVLSQPLADYRERKLFPTIPDVDALEYVDATGNVAYRVERIPVSSTNWTVVSPKRFPADASLMRYVLKQFDYFEAQEFVADVVADLSRYGLKPPLQLYRLMRGTNTVTELQIGNMIPGKSTLLHARRGDESAVYGLPMSILGQLANSPELLRDWRFAASNVARVKTKKGDQEIVLVRTNGAWMGGRSPVDSIRAGNLDLTLKGVGEMNTHRFALKDPAEEKRIRGTYRIAEGPLDLTIELVPEASRGFNTWRLEFGGELGGDRVAIARFDDATTPLQIRVPRILFEDLMRDLVW